MPDNAVILANDKVVKIKGFVQPSFNIEGKVYGFSSSTDANAVKYIYCEKFKVDDLGLDGVEFLEEGYYNEDLYLEFKSNSGSTFYYSRLLASKFDSFFKSAQVGDKIQVKKIKLITPFSNQDNLTERITYELIYHGNLDFLKSDGSVKEPTNPTEISPETISLSNTARNFYFQNIIHAEYTIDEIESYRKAIIIVKITINIHNIINKIFPLFQESTLDNFKQLQREYWNNDIFVLPDESDLNKYLISIRSFYKTAYDLQKKYIDKTGNDKFYYLAILLSSSALSILTPSNKIKLLEYTLKNKIIKNSGSEESESLVVKIVSFMPENINHINEFLSLLISTKPFVDSEKTLYQLLYENMSTSFVVTEGIYFLINQVFGSDFKPTKNKQHFVIGLYFLWRNSKYNPFNSVGGYKSNIIALRSTDPNLSSFNLNVDVSNYQYKYTHYIGFDPIYENFSQNGINYEAIKGYNETRPDASPIVIPYNSKKELGIFWDDFTFEFSADKIKVLQTLKPVIRTLDLSTPDPNDYIYYHNLTSVQKLYGTYDIYQPVTVLNTNFESRTAISFENGPDINLNGQKINSLIPVFVLAFIDDDSDRSDMEVTIGYMVDVVTTITGFGNLSKLRHLRWASTGLTGGEAALFSIQGLRIVVGGVEFTSGVLSFLGNFVECNTNDDFCNGAKEFLNVLQLACLTVNVGDSIASYAAKRKAQQLIDIANNNANNTNSLENLTQALGGTEDAEIAAHTILEFANFSSQQSRINAIALEVKKIFEVKVNLRFNKVKFNLNHFNTLDITEIVTLIHTKVTYVYTERFNKICRDFIFSASRIEKPISKDQLLKRINFYFDEINARGFSSGFNSMPQFKIFCTDTRSFFSNNFKFWEQEILEEVMTHYYRSDWNMHDYIDHNFGENFNFSERFELIVQGSANTRYKTGESLHYVTNSNLPEGSPGDFEFALRMKKKDFIIMGQIFKKTNGKFDLEDYLRRGFLLSSHNDFITIDNFLKKFIWEYRISINGKINFHPKKVKFAIVLEEGPYDLEPFTTFKYN